MLRSADGWTLIELLLAVALLAVVATVVFGSFRATVTAIDRSVASGAPARQARVVLSRLADELTSTDWDKKREQTFLIGVSQELEGHPADELRFTSRSHVWYPTQPPATELAVIHYKVEMAHNGLRLWRQEEANAFLLKSRPETYVVAEGLAAVQIRFFSEDEWHDEWNTLTGKKLPEMVEVVLVFEDEAQNRETFRTLIDIPRRL